MDQSKLMPILKDLFDENNTDKLDKDDIVKACDGFMSPDEIADSLKKLADYGALTEETNPETKIEVYGIPDEKDDSEEPKLMPIIKDLL